MSNNSVLCSGRQKWPTCAWDLIQIIAGFGWVKDFQTENTFKPTKLYAVKDWEK